MNRSDYICGLPSPHRERFCDECGIVIYNGRCNAPSIYVGYICYACFNGVKDEKNVSMKDYTRIRLEMLNRVHE